MANSRIGFNQPHANRSTLLQDANVLPHCPAMPRSVVAWSMAAKRRCLCRPAQYDGCASAERLRPSARATSAPEFDHRRRLRVARGLPIIEPEEAHPLVHGMRLLLQ